ncbi:hypothetical protein NC651_013831 [Populus alba x Populus x berolinensis]|nr:hypothetical protein NC651_013831 [Populus alba x Populus x berolinensis]
MSPAFEQVAIVLSLGGDQPSWMFPRKFLPVQWIFAMFLQLASCSKCPWVFTWKTTVFKPQAWKKRAVCFSSHA